MCELERPIPAQELLPHREPMLLIDTLTAWQPGLARSTARVTEDNPFVDRRGRLERLALIEMLAQTAAAFKGYETRITGAPAKAGFLAGISDFDFREEVRVGDCLLLEVRQTLALGQTVVLAGEIRRVEQVVGEGGLKVWEEPALPGFATQDRGEKIGLGKNPPTLDPTRWAAENPLQRGLVERVVGYETRGDENWVVGDIFFDDDFAGFHGHFPGYPLLAGVLMLELAKTICEARLGAGVNVTRVAHAKISRQVLPQDRVRAEIKMTPEAAGYAIKAKLSRGAEAVANLGFDIE